MAKKKATGSTSESDGPPSSSSDAAEEPLDFESTLRDIETAVRELESGELSLDESLAQYEIAVARMRRCYALLDAAEQKISVLAGIDADGNPMLDPMNDDTGNASLTQKQAARGRRRSANADGIDFEDDGDV